MLGNLLKSYNGNQLGEMSGNFQKKKLHWNSVSWTTIQGLDLRGLFTVIWSKVKCMLCYNWPVGLVGLLNCTLISLYVCKKQQSVTSCKKLHTKLDQYHILPSFQSLSIAEVFDGQPLGRYLIISATDWTDRLIDWLSDWNYSFS